MIITTSAIAAASTKLAAFVSHKASRGFTPAVHHGGSMGRRHGDVASTRIRAWLKANYAARGIKYVLLIGNPNPDLGRCSDEEAVATARELSLQGGSVGLLLC